MGEVASKVAQACSPSRPCPVILASGLPAAQLVVGEGQDLGRILARAAVAVRHAHAKAQRVRPLGQAVGLLQRVHGISEVVGARHPEHGHLGSGAARPKGPTSQAIAPLFPAPSSEVGKPDRIVAEETAAVHRHGEAEPRDRRPRQCTSGSRPRRSPSVRSARGSTSGRDRKREWARTTSAMAW